jgi:hypothetical protein
MGTTPIYGFPYPDPSDLVANYPALGQDLAEDVETVIAALGSGLNVVTPTTIANSGGTATLTASTVTFSGVSSVSLNGVFTATYQNYLILLESIGSGNTNTQARLRVAGTDASGSDYDFQAMSAFSSSVTASSTANGVQWNVMWNTSADGQVAQINLYRPFVAATTKFTSSGGTPVENNLIAGDHDLANAYDGISLFPNTGTFSGTVTVYGYQK